MPIKAITCLFAFCRTLLMAPNVYAFCLYSGHFNTSYIVYSGVTWLNNWHWSSYHHHVARNHPSW